MDTTGSEYEDDGLNVIGHLPNCIRNVWPLSCTLDCRLNEEDLPPSTTSNRIQFTKQFSTALIKRFQANVQQEFEPIPSPELSQSIQTYLKEIIAITKKPPKITSLPLYFDNIITSPPLLLSKAPPYYQPFFDACSQIVASAEKAGLTRSCLHIFFGPKAIPWIDSLVNDAESFCELVEARYLGDTDISDNLISWTRQQIKKKKLAGPSWSEESNWENSIRLVVVEIIQVAWIKRKSMIFDDEFESPLLRFKLLLELIDPLKIFKVRLDYRLNTLYQNKDLKYYKLQQYQHGRRMNNIELCRIVDFFCDPLTFRRFQREEERIAAGEEDGSDVDGSPREIRRFQIQEGAFEDEMPFRRPRRPLSPSPVPLLPPESRTPRFKVSTPSPKTTASFTYDSASSKSPLLSSSLSPVLSSTILPAVVPTSPSNSAKNAAKKNRKKKKQAEAVTDSQSRLLASLAQYPDTLPIPVTSSGPPNLDPSNDTLPESNEDADQNNNSGLNNLGTLDLSVNVLKDTPPALADSTGLTISEAIDKMENLNLVSTAFEKDVDHNQAVSVEEVYSSDEGMPGLEDTDSDTEDSDTYDSDSEDLDTNKDIDNSD